LLALFAYGLGKQTDLFPGDFSASKWLACHYNTADYDEKIPVLATVQIATLPFSARHKLIISYNRKRNRNSKI